MYYNPGPHSSPSLLELMILKLTEKDKDSVSVRTEILISNHWFVTPVTFLSGIRLCIFRSFTSGFNDFMFCTFINFFHYLIYIYIQGVPKKNGAMFSGLIFWGSNSLKSKSGFSALYTACIHPCIHHVYYASEGYY